MIDRTEEFYNAEFEPVYEDLIRRKQEDAGFSKQVLQDMLNGLYFSLGNNWIGRAEAKEIRLAAAIAACEAVLSEWDD